MLRMLLVWLFPVLLLTGCSDSTPVSQSPPDPGFPGSLVLVQSGSFEMGSPDDEPGFLGDETLHHVTLTHNFKIFSTEVTNRQYADLAQWALNQGLCNIVGTRLFDNLDGSRLELLDMDDDEDCEISFNGAEFVIDPGFEHHPVKEVHWFGAAAYCDWLSLKAGLPRAYNHEDPASWKCNGGHPYEAEGFRLPTEAEWEFACRGGSDTAFSGGDITETGCGEEPSLLASGWYCGNAEGWTHPVGEKLANGFGLHDMHGNVWEWCNDWYINIYPEDEVDPTGPPPGWYKVLRGGAWSDMARRCRSASRRNPSPHLGIHGRYGFRYVITAE